MVQIKLENNANRIKHSPVHAEREHINTGNAWKFELTWIHSAISLSGIVHTER